MSIDRLADVTAELSACHLELGDLMAVETEGRIMAYEQSDESSVSARDRFADYQVLNLTTDIIRLRAKIKALTVEQTYLLALIG
jgi:hypothetical protein